MQITKISFSKTVESQIMGAGIWTKIGVEGNVTEGESIGNAIEEARATVEDAHVKSGSLMHNPPTGDIFFNETTRKFEQ